MAERYRLTIQAVDEHDEPLPDVRAGVYFVHAGERATITAVSFACGVVIEAQERSDG